MQEAIQSFKFHCEFEKGLSKSTLKAYDIDLEQFHSFVKQECGNLSINQVDKYHINN